MDEDLMNKGIIFLLKERIGSPSTSKNSCKMLALTVTNPSEISI